MTNEDHYMVDERAKSIAGFISALHIFAEYNGKSHDTKYFMQAEHDIIYFNTTKPIDLDSADGITLQRLGFHYDTETDSWAYYT